MNAQTVAVASSAAVWLSLAWQSGVAHRTYRVALASLSVARRHVPRWLAAVLTICLFIPGPLDEMLVLLVIAGIVGFKPAMRRDLVASVKLAWVGA